MGSYPRVLRVSFSCVPLVLPISHHRCRLGCLEGKAGMLMGNLMTMMVVYWVNVSERSAGTGSLRLSRIKGL